MTRAVITGIGSVSAAGVGAAALSDAFGRGEPLGAVEPIETLRGRVRPVRVARIPAFDRETYISSRKLRRMGEVSQVWVIACLLARADAGLEGEAAAAMTGPERRGTFLGTGYGCIDTTWDYLLGLYRDGAGVANPYLFSESVANAPAGHSAIELDTRGACVTFTCADASAAAALEFGARAIRDERVDMAYCGGVDLMSAPLLRVLAALGALDSVGEGAICFMLESEHHARRRGARVYAEVRSAGIASDPAAPPADWGTDAAPIAAAMRRALDRAEEEPGASRRDTRVFLHPCGGDAAGAAQERAARMVLPDATLARPGSVTGALAAAGGFGLAAAALEGPRADALVCANGWGGGIYALLLRPFSVRPDPRV